MALCKLCCLLCRHPSCSSLASSFGRCFVGHSRRSGLALALLGAAVGRALKTGRAFTLWLTAFLVAGWAPVVFLTVGLELCGVGVEVVATSVAGRPVFSAGTAACARL
jgi:hypothetical protein